MTTTIRKDTRGNWKAETNVEMPDSRRLKVSTYKTDSGVVVTHATVSKVEKNWETHVMYEDFSRRLDASRYPRVTSKVIEAQHSKHDINAIIAEVLAFYEPKKSVP